MLADLDSASALVYVFYRFLIISSTENVGNVVLAHPPTGCYAARDGLLPALKSSLAQASTVQSERGLRNEH